MVNNGSIKYRFANNNDALILSVLLWEHIEEFDELDTALKDDYISTCHNHIKHRLGKDLYCAVAENNGHIVSHIFILITEKLPKLGRPNASYARLSSVRTIPKYRNKGIGSVLMDYVKNFCKEKSVEELIVWPSEKSTRFYENTGFTGENKVMEIDFFD
jgi:GNAT superfamily N-acetyltransferase